MMMVVTLKKTISWLLPSLLGVILHKLYHFLQIFAAVDVRHTTYNDTLNSMLLSIALSIALFIALSIASCTLVFFVSTYFDFTQKCFNLFLGLKHSVSPQETLCFAAKNTLCHCAKHSVPSHGCCVLDLVDIAHFQDIRSIDLTPAENLHKCKFFNTNTPFR